MRNEPELKTEEEKINIHSPPLYSLHASIYLIVAQIKEEERISGETLSPNDTDVKIPIEKTYADKMVMGEDCLVSFICK